MGGSFIIFAREDYLNGLLGHTGVKAYLPKMGPLGYLIKVMRQPLMSRTDVIHNSCEKRRVVHKKLNIRADAINKIVYINKK